MNPQTPRARRSRCPRPSCVPSGSSCSTTISRSNAAPPARPRRPTQRDVARFAAFATASGHRGTGRRDAPVAARVRLSTSRTSASRRRPIRRNVSARCAPTSASSLAEGSSTRDPSERLETPQRWRTLPEVLTVDEVEQLLAAPSLDDRWRSATARCWSWRTARACACPSGSGSRVQDVLLDDGLLRVFGKGSKERLVPDRALGDRRGRGLPARAASAAGARARGRACSS